MISPIPVMPLKPGSCAKPFFGNEMGIVDDHGNEVKQGDEGNLVIKNPWPGMARTILHDPKGLLRNIGRNTRIKVGTLPAIPPGLMKMAITGLSGGSMTSLKSADTG